MNVVFLGAFISGLLLGVRLMFFGAERRTRRHPDSLPLRRSEPAVVGFLVMFGVSGYLLTRPERMTPARGTLIAVLLAAVWATIVTRVAIAAARMQPDHDPEDPRFVLQGRVGIAITDIPAGGEGVIQFDDGTSMQTVRARDITDGFIPVGEEVCIDQVEDGVARVELWSLVEQRL